jgi:hypothetical protein
VAVKVTKHDQSDGDGLLPPDVKDDFKYVSLGREYANFMALSAGQPSRSATTPLPLVFDFGKCMMTMTTNSAPDKSLAGTHSVRHVTIPARTTSHSKLLQSQ